jgi:methylated-DNA-[protein]-cysteine S-methyltransferase
MSAATTNKPGYALFDTPIGRCALIWRDRDIIGAALPGDESLSRRFPRAEESAPPPAVDAVIADVKRLLSGERVDLRGVELDLSAADDFERRVYSAARAIPVGEVRTYGEIAQAIGSPGAARAVGRALGRNPIPIIIPCHRVLAASGRSGGFSAPGGTGTKFRILAIERARRSAAAELFEHLPLAVKPAPSNRP